VIREVRGRCITADVPQIPWYGRAVHASRPMLGEILGVAGAEFMTDPACRMTHDDFVSSRFVRPRRIQEFLSAGVGDEMLRRQAGAQVPALA
jgi:hypothetical protein